MKIYTCYHAKKKNVEDLGIVPINISLYSPRYVKYEHHYRVFSPNKETLSLEENEYIPVFKAYLATLNFKQVIKQLERIAKDRPIALMCYEKVGDFCHRHLVADWLNENGLEVKELEIKAIAKPKPKAPDLFS
jgi:uncharacterized protein (DUF488 family)